MQDDVTDEEQQSRVREVCGFAVSGLFHNGFGAHVVQHQVEARNDHDQAEDRHDRVHVLTTDLVTQPADDRDGDEADQRREHDDVRGH